MVSVNRLMSRTLNGLRTREMCRAGRQLAHLAGRTCGDRTRSRLAERRPELLLDLPFQELRCLLGLRRTRLDWRVALHPHVGSAQAALGLSHFFRVKYRIVR